MEQPIYKRAIKKAALLSALVIVSLLPFSQTPEVKTVSATTISPYSFMTAAPPDKIEAGMNGPSNSVMDGTLISAEYIPPSVQTALIHSLSSGGSNFFKLYIYNKESGNDPARVNPRSGACSLGQSLPCTRLSSVCPQWKVDYACDDRYFTGYMIHRYSAWKNAYRFWLEHSWW